jgi:mannose/fructose/N-acetylgalactosamine-specific phosphotransferase system component IIC
MAKKSSVGLNILFAAVLAAVGAALLLGSLWLASRLFTFLLTVMTFLPAIGITIVGWVIFFLAVFDVILNYAMQRDQE